MKNSGSEKSIFISSSASFFVSGSMAQKNTELVKSVTEGVSVIIEIL
jgi:hypothetical protein